MIEPCGLEYDEIVVEKEFRAMNGKTKVKEPFKIVFEASNSDFHTITVEIACEDPLDCVQIAGYIQRALIEIKNDRGLVELEVKVMP